MEIIITIDDLQAFLFSTLEDLDGDGIIITDQDVVDNYINSLIYDIKENGW